MRSFRQRGHRLSRVRTRSRTNRGKGPDTKQDAHSVLWRSYLPDDGSSTGGLQTAPPGTASTSSVPEDLERHEARIPKPLLGIAVWNQVPSHDPDAPTVLPRPDPALERLLSRVFGLDIETACALRTSSLFDAFPPYPNQIVLDARYVERRSGHNAVGRLEVCVPIPSNDDQSTDQPTTLGRLKLIVHPQSWSACHLFWPHVEQTPPKAKAAIKARLQLPGESGAHAGPVTLNVSEFSDDQPLRTQIRFQIRDTRRIASCHGYIAVQKEPGRPGAARVINQKSVQFAPGSSLAKYAPQTLRYWLQAETVCVVDKVLRSPRGGHP